MVTGASHPCDIAPYLLHVFVVNFVRDVGKSPLLGLLSTLCLPMGVSPPTLILSACQ
jgi:hypothetical protein